MTTASSIRVGLIARGDTGGLAAQTEDFFKWMSPYKVLLIDYDVFTGYKTDYSKYETCDKLITTDRAPSTDVIERFLDGLDVVFTVECPYNFELYALARMRGVKTVEAYNFEWSAYHQDPSLPKPDLLLAPSTWRMEEMEKYAPVKHLHVPVDRQKFPFKAKRKAKKFLHIAGHRTFGDRNGTAILLEALPLIQSDIKIVIRTQDELPRPYTDSKLTIIRDDVADRRDLFNDEDVLILPRKYGGLSLQLNEAMSLGMPVIMPDIKPQNEFLPKRWLVPARLKEQTMIKCPIDVYECTPQDLADKIDEFAAKDIYLDSCYSNEQAWQRDWEWMKPQYEELFKELCRSR